MIGKRVLDLNGGLGGKVHAFQKKGFDVVKVIDNDSENCKILEKITAKDKVTNSDILEIDSSNLPDVDIIIANYAIQAFSVARKGKFDNNRDINHVIYNIISQKRPQIFLIEVPVHIIANIKYNLESYMSNYITLGYEVFYQIYDEMNFSGYPVVGKQGYFIGILNLSYEKFEFPETVYFEAVNELPFEKIDNAESWYRVNNFPIKDLEAGQIYVKKINELKETKNVYLGRAYENYLVDSIGPRRFTHNEIANLKGLADMDYNFCLNKRRMYNKIANESNVYIVSAIADRILILIDNINKIKNNTESIGNTIENKEKNSNIIFSKLILKEINIKKLKGLNDLELKFEKNLTALMGVNGSGKSTILHALACVYMPFEKGENYVFSEFFTPTPDANWRGSSFTVVNYDENLGEVTQKKYEKKGYRWARYSNRPERDVFYIGITSCIPEIEIEKSTSFINYISKNVTEKHVKKIVTDAAYIMQKDYAELMLHETRKKNYIGVRTKANINYSALSMGAGEQRVIKILQTVYNAHQYSMILIDEIDLLLHANAFRKLIEKLSDIACTKKLQIIFSTHSMEMLDLEQYADIKYLDHKDGKILVYNTVNPDLLYELSGKTEKPFSIYVEDYLAQSIVSKVAKDLKMRKYINIICYGAIENAFTVAAGKVLDGEELSKFLVVTDGDKYITREEKKKRLQSVLSGTEQEHGDKIEKALSIIVQFELPKNTPPEEYIHSMLVAMDSEEECVTCAKKIRNVNNSHEWIGKIEEQMGTGKYVYYDIMEVVAENENWLKYVENIQKWIKEKQEEV